MSHFKYYINYDSFKKTAIEKHEVIVRQFGKFELSVHYFIAFNNGIILNKGLFTKNDSFHQPGYFPADGMKQLLLEGYFDHTGNVWKRSKRIGFGTTEIGWLSFRGVPAKLNCVIPAPGNWLIAVPSSYNLTEVDISPFWAASTPLSTDMKNQ